MENDSKQDLELHRVLKRASQPAAPAGAEQRLMQRVRASSLAARPQQAIVAPQGSSRWKAIAWAGLPLAASLALGIMVGSGNTAFENLLPESVVAWISPANGLELDVPFTLDDLDTADGSLA